MTELSNFAPKDPTTTTANHLNLETLESRRSIDISDPSPKVLERDPEANPKGQQTTPPPQQADLVSPPDKSVGLWRLEDLRAAPIEIWEGEVISVDEAVSTMQVVLTARLSNTPRHSAEISLEWVHEQDKDLVRPGAVFYWSLFKETRKGTIRNSEDIRFRRQPYWSKDQIARIRADAQALAKRIKPREQ